MKISFWLRHCALALLSLDSVAVVLAARSLGCGKAPTIRSGTYSTTVNGKQRNYIVKLPDNYNQNNAYRLVFTFHALNGNAAQIANGQGGTLAWYGLPPLMTGNNSAIFISPDGLNAGWANTGGEDLTFVDNMISIIENDLCVEQSLRFATGFSYGGAMSYALACARPDMVRAVAILSSAVLSGCNGGTQPVAYYHQHGTRDSVLSIAQGRQMRDRFVQNNRCTPLGSEPQPNGGRSVKTKYANCLAGKPVTWVVHDGDHNPSQTDSGSSTPFAPGNTWEFWSQFQAVGSETGGGTPTSPTTTLTTSLTTSTPDPIPTDGGESCSSKWGQCGGTGWNGPKCCQSGTTCKYSNDWYSQCQ
ncbi:Alpha/Beta hydrolase protein [Coniochaeta sp. 2T2.1]|nr:Alpha/Beta hydrolase protein [Coniochaeta sp. 2T2.1]